MAACQATATITQDGSSSSEMRDHACTPHVLGLPVTRRGAQEWPRGRRKRKEMDNPSWRPLVFLSLRDCGSVKKEGEGLRTKPHTNHALLDVWPSTSSGSARQSPHS